MEKQTRKSRKIENNNITGENTPVYVSEFSEKVLNGIQLKRSLLMAGSAVCFIVAIFLTAQFSEASKIGGLLYNLYMIAVMIAGIALLYVLYQMPKKHKLRVRTPVAYAPKQGFSKRTYLSVEIFTALLLACLVLQSMLTAKHTDIYTLIATFLTVGAVFCSTVSWIVLLVANTNAVIEGDEVKSEPAQTKIQTEKTDETDDFYN